MGGGKFTDAKLDGSNSPLSEPRPSSSPTTTLPRPRSTLPSSPRQEEKRPHRGDDDAAAEPFRYPTTVAVTVPDGHCDDDERYAIACAQKLAAEIVARSRLRFNAPVDLVSLEHLLFRRLVGVGDGELSTELERTRAAEHQGRTTYPLVGVSLDALRRRLCRDVVPHKAARGEWQRRVDQVLFDLSQISPDTRRLAEFAWWCAFGVSLLALAVVALATIRAAAVGVTLYAGMELRWHDWFGVGGVSGAPLDVYCEQSMDATSQRTSEVTEAESHRLPVTVFAGLLALLFGMSRSVFDVALVAVVWTAALYGLRLAPCVAFYAVAWCTVCRWLGEWHSESSTVPDHPTQTRPQISAVLARHVARLPSAPAYWVAHVDSVVGRRDTGCGDVVVVREGVVLEALRQSYADPLHARYCGDAGVLYVRLVTPVVASGDDDDKKVAAAAGAGSGSADENVEDDETPELDADDNMEDDATPEIDAGESSGTVEIPYADGPEAFCRQATENLRKRLGLRLAVVPVASS